ncbi:hypothetical protein ACFQ8C_26725, partial [Streptomyces sp. NPDC056503]
WLTPSRVTLLSAPHVLHRGGNVDGLCAVVPDGELLAHISRRWFRVRDTYAVDVVREDADASLLIAVAVCVIRMAERED